MDANRLRELTNRAVDRGREQAKIDAEYNAKLTELERKKVRAEADRILEQVPLDAERAARDGESSVKVMEFTDTGGGPAAESAGSAYAPFKQPPAALAGAAKLVYDGCIAAGFDVFFKWTHDGGGMRSWYEIHAGWK